MAKNLLLDVSGHMCGKGSKESSLMRFQYGCIGVILGTIVGGAAAVLVDQAIPGGDPLGHGIIFIGPIGLLVGAILGIVLALRVLTYVYGDRGARIAPHKKTLLIVSLVVGAPILAFGMLWGAVHLDDPPSDSQLLRNFEQHRTTFDQLARMVYADKDVRRIDDVPRRPINAKTPKISLARMDTYQRLMKSVGITRGFEATYPVDEIDFPYNDDSTAAYSKWNKGYAYLTKPPKYLRSELDSDSEEGDFLYRHIEGNWYLYNQNMDD